MRWSFWIELRAPAKLWVASIVFIVIGAVIAFVAPAIAQPKEDRDLVVLLLRVFGATLIVLGLAVFLPMAASLFIERREKREAWYGWINFIGGLLGALAFAVPATLIFPIFFLAYLLRPNALFPPDADAANNLGVVALFSVLGLISLAATGFLARAKLREERISRNRFQRRR